MKSKLEIPLHKKDLSENDTGHGANKINCFQTKKQNKTRNKKKKPNKQTNKHVSPRNIKEGIGSLFDPC